MGLLKKYFGEKVEDRRIVYPLAIEIIEDLHNRGAIIIRARIKNIPTFDEKNPNFNQLLEDFNNFLAPYQYEFNPDLKGITQVRYRVRDYESHKMHRFDFTQFIDNLFKKGLKGKTGFLEMRLSE